jgi:hypothetical protein
MTLPTKKTPPLDNLTDYSILIYGATKIGKTTFASQAPDVLFLATEPGTNALDVYCQPVNSWVELCAALGELAKGDHKFRTVCIDTVDNAHAFCVEHICKAQGIKGPEERKASDIYPAINREFKRVFNRLVSLDIGVIFISHAKVVQMETPVSKYDKIVPSLPNTPGSFIVGLVDIVLLADMEATRDEEGKVTEWRCLRSKPSTQHDAGDRTGRLPAVMPLSYDDVQEAFKTKDKTKGKSK